MRLTLQDDLIKRAKASRLGPTVTNLLFANDSILFREANDKRAKTLKGILNEYERASGQSVNFHKSTVFFSMNTKEEDKNIMLGILGMRSSNNAEKYLGLQNMVRQGKRASFQYLQNRIQAYIDSWNHRLLSQRGKKIFIKSVLQSIPTYTMNCFLMPKSLCTEIESLFANYWRKKGKERRGIHWCTWKNLCQLKDLGGMGSRDMAKFNLALLAKHE